MDFFQKSSTCWSFAPTCQGRWAGMKTQTRGFCSTVRGATGEGRWGIWPRCEVSVGNLISGTCHLRSRRRKYPSYAGTEAKALWRLHRVMCTFRPLGLGDSSRGRFSILTGTLVFMTVMIVLPTLVSQMTDKLGRGDRTLCHDVKVVRGPWVTQLKQAAGSVAVFTKQWCGEQ